MGVAPMTKADFEEWAERLVIFRLECSCCSSIWEFEEYATANSPALTKDAREEAIGEGWRIEFGELRCGMCQGVDHD